MKNCDNTMSYGDELGAVVADIGSFATRIGFAGNDVPQTYMPTAVGRKGQQSLFDGALSTYSEGQTLSQPVREGLIVDWDEYQQLWEYAIKNNLKVDLRDTPLLVAEKPYVSSNDRIKLAELMFERFQVPALFLSKDAVLECYSCGRTSGLAVDIGSSGTIITPVSDGWVEAKGVIRSVVGGRIMDAKMMEILSSASGVAQEKALRPVCLRSHASGSIDPALNAYLRLEIARNAKESVCRMADTPLGENEAKFSVLSSVAYELPDGTSVSLGSERYAVSELLCDPSNISFENSDLLSLGLDHTRDGALPCDAETGIPRLICDSTLRCDHDIQHAMTANIVVAGGGSAFEGLPERIRREVEKIVHVNAPTWKIKSVSPSPSDRGLSAWLGGSILASLGSFNEVWMTKAEYKEHGAVLCERKCP